MRPKKRLMSKDVVIASICTADVSEKCTPKQYESTIYDDDDYTQFGDVSWMNTTDIKEIKFESPALLRGIEELNPNIEEVAAACSFVMSTLRAPNTSPQVLQEKVLNFTSAVFKAKQSVNVTTTQFQSPSHDNYNRHPRMSINPSSIELPSTTGFPEKRKRRRCICVHGREQYRCIACGRKIGH